MKLAEIATFTDDVVGMATFYRKFLHADPIAESDGMAIFLVGKTRIFIHQTYTPTPDELAPEGHIAFEVPDVDAACDALQARGLVVDIAPRDYYWGRSAYLRDPSGRLLELSEARPGESPA